MFANIKFSKIIGSLARHAATAAGAYLITKGLPQESVASIVGVILAGGAFISSLLEKREK